MSIISIVYYLIGAFMVASGVISGVMFVAEMFRSMHAMREHCSSLEKELKDNEQQLADGMKILHKRCSAMEDEITSNKHKHNKKIAELQKDIVGISEHAMMYMQENIDAVYATAQQNKKRIEELYELVAEIKDQVAQNHEYILDRIRNLDVEESNKEIEATKESIKLIDRRLVEMRSRITVVETRSEHNVEKTDDVIECLSLLQERIAATEESTEQISDINGFLGALHERLMANEDKTERMRNSLRVPNFDSAAMDFQKKYQFGF